MSTPAAKVARAGSSSAVVAWATASSVAAAASKSSAYGISLLLSISVVGGRRRYRRSRAGEFPARLLGGPTSAGRRSRLRDPGVHHLVEFGRLSVHGLAE